MSPRRATSSSSPPGFIPLTPTESAAMDTQAAAQRFLKGGPDDQPPQFERFKSLPSKEQDRPPDYAGMALNSLPFVGGMAGGAIGMGTGTAFGLGVGGPPAAVGGAAIGGAIGRGAQRIGENLLGRRPPPATLGEATADMAREGMKQGAYELGGQLLSFPMRQFARNEYETALHFKKGFEKDRMVETALKERIPISKKGLQRQEAVARRVNLDIDALLADARDRGITITPNDLLKAANRRMRKYQSSRVPAKQAVGDAIMDAKEEFLERNLSDLDPSELRILAQDAQQMSGAVLKAEKGGKTIPTTAQSGEAQFNRDVAKAASARMRQPDIGAGKKLDTLQDLIGLEQSIRHTLDLKHPGGYRWISPAANWLIPQALRNRSMRSGLATNVYTAAPLAGQVPRTIDELMNLYNEGGE